MSTIENKPMKFIDIYNDISVELDVQPGMKLIESEINKVIRRVNDTIGLFRDVMQVTVGTTTTSVDDVNTWSSTVDATTTNVDETGRFNNNWVWSSTENRLTLSDEVVDVIGVYIDDVEWEFSSYEEVKDSGNASEKIFHLVGRYIYLPIDLDASGKVLRLDMKRNYTYVNLIVKCEDYKEDVVVDLPESYRQLLISGVLYSMCARTKYKNPDVFSVNKEIFDREYEELKTRYIQLDTYSPNVYDKIYKY